MPDLHIVPTLIERRHRATRARIADIAVRLFSEGGFDETTMEDVAEAAGVSRRTVYRHFPSKDELVFENPQNWLAHFDANIDQRDHTLPLHDICREALVAVAQLIQDDADSVLAAYRVYASTPSLRGRNAKSEDDWFERYVDLLTPADTAAPAPDVLLEVATVAGSLVGTTKALVAVWASFQPDADMVALTEAALDQLDPIWPDWLR